MFSGHFNLALKVKGGVVFIQEISGDHLALKRVLILNKKLMMGMEGRLLIICIECFCISLQMYGM